MTGEKDIYRLYAWKTTEENIELAKRFRFHRITPGYVLVYEKSETMVDINAENMIQENKSSVEITENRISALSEQDFEWLNDCNVKIIREESQRNERRIIENVSQRLEKLEQALKAEQENISGEDNVG